MLTTNASKWILKFCRQYYSSSSSSWFCLAIYSSHDDTHALSMHRYTNRNNYRNNNMTKMKSSINTVYPLMLCIEMDKWVYESGFWAAYLPQYNLSLCSRFHITQKWSMTFFTNYGWKIFFSFSSAIHIYVDDFSYYVFEIIFNLMHFGWYIWDKKSTFVSSTVDVESEK